MSARKKSDIEQLQNTPKDKSYWENHISEAVREFYYMEFNAETTEQIAKCSQNSFVSACEYARRQCINKADLMTYREHIINKHGGAVTNEVYNVEVVEIIASVYVSLCFLYDKIPSVFGFSMLTGIDRTCLESWVNEARNGVRLQCSDHREKSVKTIKAARALSLQNLAASGGKGTVGCLAVLNNEFWGKTDYISDTKRALSLSELPDLLTIEDKSGSDAPVSAVPVSDYPVSAVGLPVLGDI